jgi:hypothetical protein
LIQFVSGLDWSGDPGDPARGVHGNQWLVTCACHARKDQLDDIAKEFVATKRAMGLPEDRPFKYTRSRQELRQRFVEQLGSMPLSFTVCVVDKWKWTESYLQSTTGPERIIECVCRVFEACPDGLVGGQVLTVDGHRSEADFVRQVRMRLRQQLRPLGRNSFKKVSVVPDNRHDAMLIQAADMMAGDIRMRSGEIPEGCRRIVGQAR